MLSANKLELDERFYPTLNTGNAEYRRQNDMRTVKKNCTIPSWLNFAAERAGVNFSAILQAALKKELHITNR